MHPYASSILSRLLVDRREGHRRLVLDAFATHLRVERLPRDEIVARQDARLADLLRHARTSVPFYRNRLPPPEKIVASNARALLAELPIIRREDIQRDPQSFRAPEVPAVVDATGGSSGTPLRFCVDRATQRAREASLYWADSLAGWRYGERIAMLWGSDKDVKTASQIARAKLRWWVDNRRWYNAFNMGPEEMDQFHRDMMRFRPHIVVAYASSMEIFARHLEARGNKPSYPLKSIICSAEMLTPAARDVIERVFCRPVHNRYGNREFGAIAAECEEHDGMHINENDMIVEIESSQPESIPGAVIVTYLNNRAMPFIRYDTGDLARMADARECSCGRSTSRMQAIVGRASDTIRTKSGRLIHGEFFTHLLYTARRVREFQFVQDRIDAYRLLLVSDVREDETFEARLRQDILEAVGIDSQLKIEYVDKIEPLPSGKRKFTISMVS
jgi:phenylacetate-CoA ligase